MNDKSYKLRPKTYDLHILDGHFPKAEETATHKCPPLLVKVIFSSPKRTPEPI